MLLIMVLEKVNMVVSKSTYNDVYETVRLARSKGCQKIFTTRMVPPTYTHEKEESHLPNAEETKIALDQAIQAKKRFWNNDWNLGKLSLMFFWVIWKNMLIL